LTPQQRESRVAFRSFADKNIAPYAAEADAGQSMPRDVIRSLAAAGLLSAPTPKEWGGAGMDLVTYGLLTEELGRTCQSVRNLVAVQDMVADALWRWGSPAQRQHWLPRLAGGESVAAFALTEPGAGSDAGSVETTVTASGPDLLLRGRKKWISFGQIADLFLVFAQYEGRHTALLVERDTPGLAVQPIDGLLGLRGSMLAELVFDDARVPADSIVGRPGTGLVFVASSALDLGRYSTAWGSVGLAQACLEASVHYAGGREQYGTAISNHQLVRRMLADMVTDTTAARLLCHHAGISKAAGDVEAVNHTLLAKYRASTVANRAASDAVQIHGAHGIGAEAQVQRHYRDAKVMEIIEGTTQIQQLILGQVSNVMAQQA
jgi:alkylation response protein AidB-like acyl-CoA dehydrogenase